MSNQTFTTRDVEAALGPVLCAMLGTGDVPQAAPKEAAAVSVFKVLSDDALNAFGLFTGDELEAVLTGTGIALYGEVAQIATRVAVPVTLLEVVERGTLECRSLPELEIAAAVLWDCMARGCCGDVAPALLGSLEAAHDHVISQGAMLRAERSAVERAH